MNDVAPINSTERLPALMRRAGQRLMEAETSGEALEARALVRDGSTATAAAISACVRTAESIRARTAMNSMMLKIGLEQRRA